jgi:hypothetical protein
MSKDGVRRMVSLQASGGTFDEAWRGSTVRLSDQIAVRPGDMVVLAEWLPNQARMSGREVQGGCAVGSESGRSARYLVPVLRWDLMRVIKNTA